MPQPGDVFGNVRVVRNTGRGRLCRSDLSFQVECTVCGAKGETFEHNLRRAPGPGCVGSGQGRKNGWHQNPTRPCELCGDPACACIERAVAELGPTAGIDGSPIARERVHG